jgi:predicted NBD/HSP70 family sugar kinase
MNIDEALKDLGETHSEPATDMEAGRERLRAAIRRLHDDPLEEQRIDNLARRIDRHERDCQRGREALRKQDLSAAERYLRRAAQHGNDEAAYMLGLLLDKLSIERKLKGKLHKADKYAAEARQWRLRAQESGFAEAFDETGTSDITPQLPSGHRGDSRRESAQDNAHERENDTGPPARRAACESEDRYVVGIELRPYGFTVVLANGDGEIIGGKTADLSGMNRETVVSVLAAAAREIVASALGQGFPAHKVALGVQLGGPVDTKAGTVHFFSKHPPGYPAGPSEFRWEDFPLARRLQQEAGYETVLLNDAVAFAERERWFGVGQDTGDFVVMLIREGVGGAVVKHGEHFDGPVEIGNFLYGAGNFDQDFEPGDAQLVGVLEVAGGTTGIAKSAAKRCGPAITDIQTAAEAAEHEGPEHEASTAFLEAGLAVRRGISYLVQFAGPSHVVVYAPEAMVSPEGRAARSFLGQVKTFREAVAFKAFRRCELVTRPLSPNDGAHGAALAALSRCFQIEPKASRISTGALR